jgi:DNA-binding NarL/FixJ family response regulator
VDEQVAARGNLRVLVVEGAWWWREAMLRVLEHAGGVEPVAPVGAVAVRRLLRELTPDVAIVDLDDPDGAAILSELRHAEIPCIALGDGRGRSQVAAALDASASYVVKSELDPERLQHLVTIAAAGDALFVQASQRVLENLVRADEQTVAARYALTPREAEVLEQIAFGRTNAEIAERLHLAPSSVKKLVSRCLARLGVRNRVEAALLARREGLVPPA